MHVGVYPGCLFIKRVLWVTETTSPDEEFVRGDYRSVEKAASDG
jgi:hypothetical protein